jgi:molecular chaperone GrpE
MGEAEPVSKAREEPPAAEAEGQTAAAEEMLQQQVALLEAQLKTMRDSYLRAMADLDNTRKRARHELAEAQLRASADLLLDILPIVDNFERAQETMAPGPGAPPEVQAVYDGVSLIYRQLMDLLARRGVKSIEAVGKPFDTRRHEAVVQVPVASDEADGVVALETQKGYLLGDRVLRASKVGVAVREEPREEKKEGEGESG